MIEIGGVGRFAAKGSVRQMQENSISNICEQYVISLIREARRINLTSSEIIKLIERSFEEND